MFFGVLIRSVGVSLKFTQSVKKFFSSELELDVTILSPNTYFNFTPLLASTAVGTLEFRCAVEPVGGGFLKNRPIFNLNLHNRRFVGTLLEW